METAFCGSCGAKLASEAKFCPKCGTTREKIGALTDRTAVPPSESSQMSAPVLTSPPPLAPTQPASAGRSPAPIGDRRPNNNSPQAPRSIASIGVIIIAIAVSVAGTFAVDTLWIRKPVLQTISMAGAAEAQKQDENYGDPVYASCTDKASGNDGQFRDCQVAAQQRLESKLTAAYKAAMANLPPEHQAELKEGERAWIKFREADCGLSRSIYDGGTAGLMVGNDCYLQRTWARLKDLEETAKFGKTP